VGKALDEDDRSRLAEIEVDLDQCWDPLNQRRALRDFGLGSRPKRMLAMRTLLRDTGSRYRCPVAQASPSYNFGAHGD
jgi:hypothetical protein